MRRLGGPTYALAIGFWLLTSVYALLSSQPFAYEQFLKPRLLPPLAAFADWHPWLNLCVFAITLMLHWPKLRPADDRQALAPLFAWGLISLALLLLPPLAGLGPGRLAPIMAGLALVPVGLILWLEYALASRPLAAAEAETASCPHTSSDFLACLAAGAISAVLYAAVSRLVGGEAGPVSGSEAALGFTRSLLVHELLFLAAFCGLTLLRGLAEFFVPSPRRAELLLAAGSLVALALLVVHTVLLPGLSLDGPAERAVGSLFGLALALSIAVYGLCRSDPAVDGVTRVLWSLAPRRVGQSALATGLWLLMLGAVALVLAFASQQADWNRILSRVGVMIVWLLVLATCLRSVRAASDRNPGLLYLAACAVLALHVMLGAPFGSEQLAHAGVDSEAVRKVELGRDASFRLLDEILQPPAKADLELFSLLRQHTNISRSLRIDPVELSLAKLEGEPAPYRPHIFVFVVDSLRRDYLSAYNPAVDFTPEIERFASDSTVFQNAFTRYGATGLSIPALWMGAPMLHKQYVTPFAPMNTLARLLEHERYAQWISMDNILDVILPASEARDPLDAKVMVKDFRFCQTLGEIQQRLSQRPADAPPVFAYSLPQDIHVSVVTREGGRSLDDESYPGFSAPVASRIRRFDACFGGFVDFLRAQGLYDDSLIILSSDHGDSLGEEGRIGHAYGLFPEVIRIPLIVSLPARMRQRLELDPRVPAYNTDLTPTLYRLLGHELAPSSELFGRPLLRSRDGRPPAPDEGVMVASSYGAVYGALLDSAKQLYIVDTVNVREYGYALESGLLGRSIDVDAKLRRRGQATIRRTIQALAEQHDYRPEP